MALGSIEYHLELMFSWIDYFELLSLFWRGGHWLILDNSPLLSSTASAWPYDLILTRTWSPLSRLVSFRHSISPPCQEVRCPFSVPRQGLTRSYDKIDRRLVFVDRDAPGFKAVVTSPIPGTIFARNPRAEDVPDNPSASPAFFRQLTSRPSS